MKDYLTAAIRKLKPNSEFSYQNDDYSTINWIVLNGNAPTQAEIDLAIEQIKAEEEAEKATQSQKRLELLDRLGITEEEARILLG